VLSAGFAAHVPKPVEPEVLVEVLSRVLTRDRAGGERLH
jgi:CheY-like chemotaxis protein